MCKRVKRGDLINKPVLRGMKRLNKARGVSADRSFGDVVIDENEHRWKVCPALQGGAPWMDGERGAPVVGGPRVPPKGFRKECVLSD